MTIPVFSWFFLSILLVFGLNMLLLTLFTSRLERLMTHQRELVLLLAHCLQGAHIDTEERETYGDLP